MNQEQHLYRWLVVVLVVFVITNLALYWAFDKRTDLKTNCAHALAKWKDPPAYLKLRCKKENQ